MDRPKALSSPTLGGAECEAGKGCSISGCWHRGKGRRDGDSEIYAAGTGVKRGGRQPRSEAALPKSRMNLQERWRERQAWEEMGRGGRRSRRWSRTREQDRTVRDGNVPSQNDRRGMRGSKREPLASQGGQREQKGEGAGRAVMCLSLQDPPAQFWGANSCQVPSMRAEPLVQPRRRVKSHSCLLSIPSTPRQSGRCSRHGSR